MSKAKIFVIYHKPEEAVKNDILTPICVGPNKDDFSSEFLRDDVGDNIAEKNAKYNEITAIYWVFKHLEEFKDVDYIGFSHYRRLFAFSALEKTSYVKKNADLKYINCDEKMLDSYFREYDLLVPSPTTNKTVRKHYEQSHNKEDLSKLLDIIKGKFKDYYSAAVDYFENHTEYLYNMFVFKKDDFIKYGEFLFGVIDEFEKTDKNDRLYISERITGIFIYKQIMENKNALNVPVYHIRKKSFKSAKAQVKENKKNRYKFFMRIKPLLLCLLPRWLEQSYRRRITK